MPRRSDRLEYEHHFEGNPLGHLNAQQAYEELRWGNASTGAYELDGPEPELIELGRLVLLELDTVIFEWDECEAPYLAVGLESNRLYGLPIGPDGHPEDLGGPLEYGGAVHETHYIADKGGDDAYWFHPHEAPLPQLWANPETGAFVIEPADHEGGPSYVVGPEGIIG